MNNERKMKTYRRWAAIAWPAFIVGAAGKAFWSGHETAGVIYLSTAAIVLAIGLATLHIEAVIRETKTEK